jgi:uncharacterized membrane protein
MGNRFKEASMSRKAAITINRSPQDIHAFWNDRKYRPQYIDQLGTDVSIVPAPGDRGTEIHVIVPDPGPAGVVGEAVQKVLGTEPMAKAKDDLRRFKQLVETGEIARSDAAPEGELVERKLKQRPAQPLAASEREKAGV